MLRNNRQAHLKTIGLSFSLADADVVCGETIAQAQKFFCCFVQQIQQTTTLR